MMVMGKGADLEKLLESYADRAHREFEDAWSRITHPAVRQRRQYLLDDLNRYYTNLPKDFKVLDANSVAERLAIALEELLPLLLVLRIETDILLGNPSIAYATPSGSITFCWTPFFVKNWDMSPVKSVVPDKSNDTGLGRLVYIWNDSDFFVEASKEKLLHSDDSDLSDGGLVADLVLWPDGEPMFDTVYLAALTIHEACHIGMGHFLPTIYDGLPSRVARYLQQHKNLKKRASMNRLVKKLGERAYELVARRVTNVLLDASIHTIIPTIVQILDIGAKKRIPFGIGGGGIDGEGGIPLPTDGGSESQGDSDGSNAKDVADAARDERGSAIDDVLSGDKDAESNGTDTDDGEGKGRANRRPKDFRKVHQKGEPIARRLAKDPSSVEQVAKNLKDAAKRIGSETGILDSVFALIAKLRRDPFMKMQMHRSAFRGLFGVPKQRSMNPRADEVYLRKHGLIKYLPRFTRQPVVRELTVIVDTSGSMSDAEIGKALGVLKQLAGSHYLFNLLVCDTRPILIGKRMRSIPDSVECPRGGTALGEGVRQAKELGLNVENIVYITDGYNTDWADDVDEVRNVCVILTVPKKDGDTPEQYIEQFRERVLARRSNPPAIHVIYMEDVVDVVGA
jgi:hypothetical protein